MGMLRYYHLLQKDHLTTPALGENKMNESILTTVKAGILGITEEYEAFDAQLIVHINSAISTLTQLGVGPSDGYYISDDEDVWTDFIGDSKLLEHVKQYVVLSVKRVFDPPSNSFLVDIINKQLEELVWRICVRVDEMKGTV